MKNNKSPGSDEAIITEALKCSGDSLHAGSNKRSLKPKRDFKQCCENIIIPISKKASKHMKDFKGMNLMSIAGKVYNKMQLNSIYEPTNIQLTSYVPFKQDLGRVETVWSKFIY